MSVTAAQVYTYVVANSCGSDAATITVDAMPILDAAFAYATLSFCTSDPIDPVPITAAPGGSFSSTPGLAFDPSTGAIDLAASTPGTYIVVHSTTGICSDQDSLSITIVGEADASWHVPGNGELCSTMAPILLDTLIDGDPGGVWSGDGVSGNLFDPGAVSGVAHVMYTTGPGLCTDSLELVIVIVAGPVADAGDDQEICDLTGHLSANGVGLWTAAAGSTLGNASDPNTVVTVTASGTYAFVWTVGTSLCHATDTVLITFHEPSVTIWADAGDDQRIGVFTSTDLMGDAPANTMTHWSVLQGTGVFGNATELATGVSGLSIGDNVFVLSANLGPCASASDTVVVTVDELNIPQGFSPNGDGVNDLFDITGIRSFPDNDLAVFNRWGQQVYDKKSYDNSWNGAGRNGQPLPDDTYFYVLNLAEGRTYNGYLIIKR